MKNKTLFLKLVFLSSFGRLLLHNRFMHVLPNTLILNISRQSFEITVIIIDVWHSSNLEACLDGWKETVSLSRQSNSLRSSWPQNCFD